MLSLTHGCSSYSFRESLSLVACHEFIDGAAEESHITASSALTTATGLVKISSAGRTSSESPNSWLIRSIMLSLLKCTLVMTAPRT